MPSWPGALTISAASLIIETRFPDVIARAIGLGACEVPSVEVGYVTRTPMLGAGSEFTFFVYGDRPLHLRFRTWGGSAAEDALRRAGYEVRQ